MLNFTDRCVPQVSRGTWFATLVMVLALGAACNAEDRSSDPCERCSAQENCVEGVCYAPGCPPEGPYGTHPGDRLLDVVVYDCEDNPVHIHSLCGANVGYFNLLAGW